MAARGKDKTGDTADKKPKSPPTRCDDGGGELLPLSVKIRPSDIVELSLTLCKSPFQVFVTIDDNDRDIVDEARSDELEVTLPSLSPGFHVLHWGYLATADDWKVRSEVSVNGVVIFRQRKSNDGSKPYTHSFLFMEVV